MGEIDHERTDELVCPHCGYRYTDSYEFFDCFKDDANGIECRKCEREFDAVRNIRITYSTESADPPNFEQMGQYVSITQRAHGVSGQL